MAVDPEQIFFKISELSELLGVESHVLRFWEKEFSQIRPMKMGPRKRLYRRKDLETFQKIKRLLYEDRFTIAGAKKRLERPDIDQGELFEEDRLGQPSEINTARELADMRELLDDTRRELLKIKDILIANKNTKPDTKDFNKDEHDSDNG
ncbi:MerR family transcriptional regulator [Deltaproteobacteria bacterium Smac51]|nr:MerR family transcriptional regulator [Deltaproteobacteria bacterium Smac51]